MKQRQQNLASQLRSLRCGRTLQAIVEDAGFECVCDEANMVNVLEAIANETAAFRNETVPKTGFSEESNKLYIVSLTALATKPGMLNTLLQQVPCTVDKLLGLMWKPGHTVAPLLKSMTALAISKWLQNMKVVSECIVCFEDISTRVGGRRALRCCECSTSVCQQCVVDRCRNSESLQPDGHCELDCPNCREKTPLNLHQFCHLIKKMHNLKFFNEETRRFADEMYISWHRRQLMDEVVAVLNVDRCEFDASDPMYLNFMKKHGLLQRVAADENRGAFERGLIGDTSAASGFVSDDVKKTTAHNAMHCPQCEKAFWDASERKRAPKCGRCKRVSYCSVRCRAKHSSSHSAQCKGKPKGRTPKRKGNAQKRKGKKQKKKPKRK